MNNYIENIHSIISDARLAIKEEGLKALKKAKNEEEEKKIKLASVHYEVMLSGLLLYEDNIKDSINDKIKLINNEGAKVELEKDPTIKENLSTETYAYEGEVGAFVSDEDPFVVETKSGKRIVLDSDPVFYINSSGKKIELDEDPKFKIAKTNKKIVLDEDPVSVKTKSGKKIILDSDPESIKTSNKIIILSEDPKFKLANSGTIIELDEDPKFKKFSSNTKIELDEDPISITINDDDQSDNEASIDIEKLKSSLSN